MENIDKSYIAHKANIENKDPDQYLKYESSTRTILKNIEPLLSIQASWLTIGDHNGLEANYIINKGLNVVASDISGYLLELAKERGLIEQFAVINVESIPMQADSVDYILCKETYHHLPRPYLGVYEMLRCARQGVVLIEPIDVLLKVPMLLFLKNTLDRINPRLINKIWRNRFSFEPVGNYVFKLSEREMEKLAMGIGLPMVAFKPINFHHSWLYGILSKLHFLPRNHLVCLLFKTKPTESVIRDLVLNGYKTLDLPSNNGYNTA